MNTSLIQTVSATDARARFNELMNLAYYNNATIVVTRMDKPTIKITRADDNNIKPNRDLTPFIGIWADDGDKIKKEMKKFRRDFKFIRE